MSDETPTAEAPDERVLFCPFCRESHEGETHCEVHDLPLVEFHRLPRRDYERVGHGLDEDVGPLELRYGRGVILLGVALAMIGFLSPFATGTFEGEETVWSGLAAASLRLPSLWTVPFAAVLFLSFVLRRRTVRAMRGARLAALILAAAPALAVGYAAYRVLEGAARTFGAVEVALGPGAYLMGASSLVLALGGLAFGVAPRGAVSGEPLDLDEPSIDVGPTNPG
ncbi:MAG: hypothetical protein ACFCGT_04310 [Sandaracinaceae bacterium]